MEDFNNHEELENLDYSKMPAIQQKRTLAFVNHYVFTTVQFMNNFIRTCEEKFMQFERKLEKAEASMILLEARLSSIPEINKTTTLSKTLEVNEPDREPEPTNNITTIEEHKEETSSIDPQYTKFVKMVAVGVPLAAVKLKLSMEGLDPDILEKALKLA